MKLKGLLLDKEVDLEDGISEFWTVVDPTLLPGGSYMGGPIEVQEERYMTLLRLALHNLHELLKEFPRLAVLTSDVSEGEERPYDRIGGDLPGSAFENLRHVSIHAGFWEKDFEKGPDVRNTLFLLDRVDYPDFQENYLGGHPGLVRYWFLLGKEEVELERAKALIESAEARSSFIASLLELASVVTYGFELDAYAFFTRDEGLKAEIRGLTAKR